VGVVYSGRFCHTESRVNVMNSINRVAIAAVCLLVTTSFLVGCGPATVTTGDSISSDDLQSFFGKHKIDGNGAVAIMKRSFGEVSYLATIHGYPTSRFVSTRPIG
jgi:hypothetical protein